MKQLTEIQTVATNLAQEIIAGKTALKNAEAVITVIASYAGFIVAHCAVASFIAKTAVAAE